MELSVDFSTGIALLEYFKLCCGLHEHEISIGLVLLDEAAGRSVNWTRRARSASDSGNTGTVCFTTGEGGSEQQCRAGSLTETCYRPHEAETSRVRQVDILLTLDTERTLGFSA
jgi:hypothetical protein